SEICVVADDTAPAHFVAADLLSQAEHDEAATAICVTLNEIKAKEIQKEVMKQLNKLARKEVAQASIEQNGKIIVDNSFTNAFTIVNALAPEHLQLRIKDVINYLYDVRHSGLIFL